MASSKHSRPSILVSKELEDELLMKKFGISPVGRPPPNKWPKHLFDTFQQIKRFRTYDIQNFCNSGLKPNHQITWNRETADRAKRIVETCSILLKDNVSEMEWRLRLEELVLARFRLEIECPNNSCRKRLWRSETEAIVESPGPITASLEDRRERRKPCECELRQGAFNVCSVGVNKIFSSRSDEMILYNPFEKRCRKSMKTSPIRNREPDRILGLQETGSFNRRLESIARRLQDEAGIQTIRETVECTVLNHKSGLLLFPFLVIEAKKETGKGISACTRQTAFPIWKMLKIQEELHSKSQEILEYGGPLLWYIAYRGDEWCVSGCYTVEKKGKTHYEILILWSGFLSDDNDALQMLLIIDYIFDWARDIYRPTIIGQLEALARPMENTDNDVGHRPVRVRTDSDIFSLAGDQQRMDIDAWIDSTEDPPEAPHEGDLHSQLNPANLEISFEDSSVTSPSNSNSARFNSSDISAQKAFEAGSRKEFMATAGECSVRGSDWASTRSSISQVGEDEAAELKAAMTDSTLIHFQELFMQGALDSTPNTAETAVESPEIEKRNHYDSIPPAPDNSHIRLGSSKHESDLIYGSTPNAQSDRKNYFESSSRTPATKGANKRGVLKNESSSTNLNSSFPETQANVKANTTSPNAASFRSSSLTPPISPPSLIDTVSTAPPTRAGPSSPSPLFEPRSSKRPLENGNDLEILAPRKRVKNGSSFAEGEVIIID